MGSRPDYTNFMKKIILVFLMVIAFVCSASALQNVMVSSTQYTWDDDGTGIAGLEAGYQMGWVKLADDDVSQSTTSQTFTISFRGANYFGDNDNFGVGYGLGWGKFVTGTSDGASIDTNGVPSSFTIETLFQYKMDFSDAVMLEIGVGPKVGFSSQREGTIRTSRIAWSLVGRLDFVYAFPGGFALQAGCAVGVPFAYQKRQRLGSATSVTQNYRVSGVTVTPTIGCLFCY